MLLMTAEKLGPIPDSKSCFNFLFQHLKYCSYLDNLKFDISYFHKSKTISNVITTPIATISSRNESSLFAQCKLHYTGQTQPILLSGYYKARTVDTHKMLNMYELAAGVSLKDI